MDSVLDVVAKGVMELWVNPPSASHMAGIWDRMIQTTRNVLVGVIKSHDETAHSWSTYSTV